MKCREKLKKLKAEYRKIKDKQGKTGEGRKEWAFFNEMDTILCHKPATQPHVVIDTSAEPDVEGWGVHNQLKLPVALSKKVLT